MAQRSLSPRAIRAARFAVDFATEIGFWLGILFAGMLFARILFG